MLSDAQVLSSSLWYPYLNSENIFVGLNECRYLLKCFGIIMVTV